MKSRIILLILLLIFQDRVAAQAPRPTTLAKTTIEHFLTSLLLHKKVTMVKRYLSTRAYKNEMLLSADCLGTLAPSASPKNRKKQIQAFFKMIAGGVKGKRLKTILKSAWTADASLATNSAQVLARPKKEGYLLLRVSTLKKNVPADQEEEYLRSRFPQGPYLILTLFVKLTNPTDRTTVDYPIYFLWQKEKGQWKIVHLNTMCI